MCVRTKDIPVGSGLIDPAAANCPIPCNPTWSSGDIAAVCGSAPNRVCCQTVELGDKDCVQEDGVWRPVTGADIGVKTVVPNTVWNNVAHDTHQDPNGTVCMAYAATTSDAAASFAECIRHLTVANQRGFCMSLQAGQVCPTNPDPPPMGAGYISICDRKNGMVPPG
jgi:hypothetical protein